MNRPDKAPVMRKHRGIAIGFLFAFVLTTATIIYTGLFVRAPGSQSAATGTPVSGEGALESAAPGDSLEAQEPEETDQTGPETTAVGGTE